MTFVRPEKRSQPEKSRVWLPMLGAADEHDGRALDALARALRLIANSWIAIMVARTAAMSFFIGWGRVDELFGNLFFSLFLGGAVLADLAIVASPLVKPIMRLSPNRRLVLLAPLVMFSSATFQACAAHALRDAGGPLLATTLGPAMVAVLIFGRRRGLSLAYGCGAVLAQLIVDPSLWLAMPLLQFMIGLALVLTLDAHIRRRNLAFTLVSDSVMTGEQAKAMLVDFEKAGRGWFWETDRIGRITYISDALAAQTGSTASALIGTSFESLIAPPERDAEREGQRTLSFHFSARTAFSDIAVLCIHTADERWWSISGQPVITPFGQFLGFRGSGSDLTAMRRSQAEVARLANVDSLTGLANRSQMMQVLEQALSAQRGLAGECALMLLDLDRFKEVNDTMGHPAGDALLRQVAQRLQRLIGSQGRVGRLGGDEFQFVLPGMTEMIALAKLADAIIHGLSEPYSIDGSQVVIGASIGIALAPADGSNSETLIRNADLALYAAKGDGRGRFRFFMPCMHSDAEDRRQLEADLRQAIHRGGLHLDYQPVVCAASERITGFEALVRWTHAERGPVSPAVFIPVAEDAGLIGIIGEWVMRTACADAAQWPTGTRVAVNVSPIQFANPELPGIVMRALAHTGLPAAQLELEITESVFLAERDDTDSMFAKLKGVGVRLALDDFGTGYSALGYLKTAPFDKIKIDQSFVRGAAIKGSRNGAIVKSIVNLAEALGMETTAEGAETLDELDLIRSLGCSHVQGYVYGRPMSIENTLAVLAQQDGHAIAQGLKSSRAPRRTMLRTVTLCHGGNRYPGRIRNVSASGAMIEGLVDVPAGTIFSIEFNPEDAISCVCRWSAKERMGIEFAEEINLERLRASDKPAASHAIPDQYRVARRQAS